MAGVKRQRRPGSPSQADGPCRESPPARKRHSFSSST